MKPKTILELGLGQSTKLISQYVDSVRGCHHFIVEHDKEWVSFFNKSFALSESSKIFLLDLKGLQFNECEKVNQYDKFSDFFSDKIFNLISIDGPIGNIDGTYSRIDILKIFPECLDKSFVILLDDIQRTEERKTQNLILNELNKNEIQFHVGEYKGIKTMSIITSKDLKFLCSM